MKKFCGLLATVAATLGLGLAAPAQDTTQPNPNPPVNDPGVGEAQETIREELKDRVEDRAGTVQPDQGGEQADHQASKGRLYRTDDLIDAKIRNPQGEDLGEVEEMVVDVNSGDVRYAVVSYGGFLDLGDKLFAVPLQAMKLDRNADDEVFYVVDIDQQRLENAEGFDEDNWPNFSDAAFTSAVDRMYGIESPQASGQAALYKLSTFDGVNVRSRENTELGEVEWILVDPAQAKVIYLGLDLEDDVADRDNEVGDDDLLVLVPMEQFSLKTQNDDTFLQASGAADEVRHAPTVTEGQFKKADSHDSHQDLRKKVDDYFKTDLSQPKPEK